MTTGDTRAGLQRMAFIDLEASGLGSASFPTGISWAIVRKDGSLNSGSCLLRPSAKWTFYRNAWSAASERLTGITRAMLDEDGLPPSQALTRFLEAVGDRELFSDDPEFDFSLAFDVGGRRRHLPRRAKTR